MSSPDSDVIQPSGMGPLLIGVGGVNFGFPDGGTASPDSRIPHPGGSGSLGVKGLGAFGGSSIGRLGRGWGSIWLGGGWSIGFGVGASSIGAGVGLRGLA